MFQFGIEKILLQCGLLIFAFSCGRSQSLMFRYAVKLSTIIASGVDWRDESHEVHITQVHVVAKLSSHTTARPEDQLDWGF